MFKQGVLPFRYECEPTESGMTALAGLPAYLELVIVSGLIDSIQRHLGECTKKEQGWTDTQIVVSLVFLNIAGGDSVDDLRILEKDEGLVKVVRQLGFSGHPRKVLAFNLNSLMKHLALPEGWQSRLKAVHFGFINLAGRVVNRSRQLIIRLSGSHPAYPILLEVRRRLRAL